MCSSGNKSGRNDSNPNSLPASDGGRPALERILISLQAKHRRYLLYHLQEEDTAELDEAARQIAAWDEDCSPSDVPSALHERIQTELYHIHLPKLEDLNVIEYDERSGTMRFRSPPDNLDSFLELARKEDAID